MSKIKIFQGDITKVEVDAIVNAANTTGFAINIGWTGLLVALVAREKALVAIPVAFVFAGLRTGSSFVGSTGVEGRITDVIQGFLVLALLVPPAVMFLRDRRRARAAATERA